MPLLFNLRHLDEDDLHLKGELPVADLELESLDEVIHAARPLAYDVAVQKMDAAILVQGALSLTLDCECVRCLKPFQHLIQLNDWTCHLALEGEEQVSVMNDSIDLTPYFREDIVLAFPQHPLCKPDCGGLADIQKKAVKSRGAETKSEATPSDWTALDKLKL